MEPKTSPDPPLPSETSEHPELTHGSVMGHVITYGGPLVVGMMLHTFFNLVDFFICARLGPDAINAVGISDIIMMIPTVVANGICTGSIAIIARNYGLKKFHRASSATWHSFLLMFALGAVTALVGCLFGEAMLKVFIDDTRKMGAYNYLMISACGSITMFLMLQVTSVLRAGGESMWPMAIFFMCTFLNVIGDILLVFGYRPLGIPAMGISGAALASVLARMVGIGVGAMVLFKGRQRERITMRRWRLSIPQFMLLIKIGLPSSLQMVVRVLAVFILAAIVYAVDPASRAGYIICVRLDMLAIFWCLGWGAGASTLVGQNLGAGLPDRAERSGWYSALLGGIMLIAVAVCFIQWSEPLVGFFAETTVEEASTDIPQEQFEHAKAVGNEYLSRVAPTYAFLAISIILALSLNGAGSTKTPLFFDLVILLFVMIPVAYLARGQGLAGVWNVIAGANVLLALPYILWFRLGRWKSKKLQ